MRSILLLLLVAAGSAAGDVPEEVRGRRRAIEVRYAGRFMEVAEEARKARSADLAREAFTHAESLDPGNEAVLAFDPDAPNGPGRPDARRADALARRLADLRTGEAKERIALALWCDGEAFADEALEEARAALALAPGPLAFDEEGVLTDPALGRLPKSLSISLLDGHEVFRGRLVPLSEVPEQIPWKDGWSLETEHFLVKTNVSGSTCRTMGRALEAARTLYAEQTGLSVSARITVYVLAKRSAYEEYLVKLKQPRPASDNIGKCIDDFCAVDGSRSEKEVVSVAIHEVAHGWVNLGLRALTGVKGASMPVWYSEGLATFCAGFGGDSHSFSRGALDPARARRPPLERLQSLQRLRQVRPLPEFMATVDGDTTFYLQAFGFYWFLAGTPDEDLRASFRRAVERMMKGASDEDGIRKGNAVFAAEMGDLSALEARFHDWLRGLDLSADPPGD